MLPRRDRRVTRAAGRTRPAARWRLRKGRGSAFTQCCTCAGSYIRSDTQIEPAFSRNEAPHRLGAGGDTFDQQEIIVARLGRPYGRAPLTG